MRLTDAPQEFQIRCRYGIARISKKSLFLSDPGRMRTMPNAGAFYGCGKVWKNRLLTVYIPIVTSERCNTLARQWRSANRKKRHLLAFGENPTTKAFYDSDPHALTQALRSGLAHRIHASFKVTDGLRQAWQWIGHVFFKLHATDSFVINLV